MWCIHIQYEKPNKEDEFTFGDIYKSYYAVGWMKRYTEHLCEMYSTFLNPTTMYSSQTTLNIYALVINTMKGHTFYLGNYESC